MTWDGTALGLQGHVFDCVGVMLHLSCFPRQTAEQRTLERAEISQTFLSASLFICKDS